MQFDETKPEPIVTPDTPNRTQLYFQDAKAEKRLDGSESEKQFYRRLNKINMGTHIRSHTNQFEMWTDEWLMRRADNFAVFDAVSSALDLPKSLKRWGRNLFGQLDLRAYRRQNEKGMAPVLAAFAVSAYVCFRKGWKTHPNHPTKHREFAELKEHLGITDQEFARHFGRAENQFRPRMRAG
jgi:hypothetical protein